MTCVRKTDSGIARRVSELTMQCILQRTTHGGRATTIPLIGLNV